MKGDAIHEIPGIEVPVLLRRDHTRAGGTHWKLVGLVYVDTMNEFGETLSHFTLASYWATEPELEDIILT